MKRRIYLLAALLAVCVGVARQAYAYDDPIDYFYKSMGLDPAEEYLRTGLRCYQTQEYDKAYQNFANSHNRGNTTATYYLAELYFNGQGVAQDLQKGMKLLNEAASKGEPQSCYFLGMLYKYGSPYIKIEQDLERAEFWLNTAVQKGHPEAAWVLGDIYYDRGEMKKAFPLFKKSAEAGSADGKYMLGICYRDGDGIERDLNIAESFLKEAQRAGVVADFDVELGKLYFRQGRYEEAQTCFERKYKAKPDITRWLGSTHFRKAIRDKSTDYSEAIKYWNLAAEQGELEGMFLSAMVAYDGFGGQKDYNKAVSLFEKVLDASGGSVKYNDEFWDIYACSARFLGNCYRYGRGVPVDADMSAGLVKFAEEMGIGDITVREVMDNLMREKY